MPVRGPVVEGEHPQDTDRRQRRAAVFFAGGSRIFSPDDWQYGRQYTK
jgi:hypothetical protein